MYVLEKYAARVYMCVCVCMHAFSTRVRILLDHGGERAGRRFKYHRTN